MTKNELFEKLDPWAEKHTSWRIEFTNAILNNDLHYDLEEVRRDDLCEFGQWLKKGKTEFEKLLPENYKRAIDLHREYHEESARILELALAGKKEEAQEAMGQNSKYEKVCDDILNEIENIKKYLIAQK